MEVVTLLMIQEVECVLNKTKDVKYISYDNSNKFKGKIEGKNLTVNKFITTADFNKLTKI